jgi:YHS domain-containing protein
MPVITWPRVAPLAALLAIGLAAGAGNGMAEEPKQGVKAYPFPTCLVSNEKIDPQVPAVLYKGQEYRFCCKGCAKKFARDPDKYAALLAASARH